MAERLGQLMKDIDRQSSLVNEEDEPTGIRI